MCSVFNRLSILPLLCSLLSCSLIAAEPARDDRPPLRVAADPNNLPFSNDKQEGFENKIAELVARDLGRRLEYYWHAQRRGFFRQTLKEGRADLVMGVPAGFEIALTTRPYYRSSYVFVTREGSGAVIDNFDAAVLRTAKIGIQLVGDDGVNTPPAHALANRGIITNLVGFTVYGDYHQPNPPADIVRAVEKGDIDVAVVWGPLGGYFARHSPVPLSLQPVQASDRDKPLRYAFSIAMAVQKRNTALRDQLNLVIERRRPEIEEILKSFGVPTLPIPERKGD